MNAILEAPLEIVAKIEKPTFGFNSVTGILDHFRFVARISHKATSIISIHGAQKVAKAMLQMKVRSSLEVEKASAILTVNGNSVEFIRFEGAK